jgi:hypothetical protein
MQKNVKTAVAICSVFILLWIAIFIDAANLRRQWLNQHSLKAKSTELRFLHKGPYWWSKAPVWRVETETEVIWFHLLFPHCLTQTIDTNRNP